jgi:hypothetical protein
MHDGSSAAMAAYDPAAAAAAAVVAQQEADRVDAELQQLLAQWNPDDTPAAAAAAAAPVTAAVLSSQAMSAPAGCGGFSQQLGCSFSQQQQMSMPLSMQGLQGDMSSAGPSAALVGFAAPQQQQQQAPAQLKWKPAFAPAARNSSSSGALSVTVPISVPAGAAAASLQGLSPFTGGCSSMQGSGSTPMQIVYPAGRQPRARKGKGSGSKASQQQQTKKQQQQQLTMQLQVPASALPAAVPPGAHVVLHLKPNQQQQLMAVVERLVQQRLAQTYEAGYRAGTQNVSSSMSAGSMPPPPPVQQQMQGRMASAAAASGELAGGTGAMNMEMPAPSLLQGSDAAAAAAAEPVGQGMMVSHMMMGLSGGAHCVSGGLAMPRQSQQQHLVDDILPSMQDLLTDCCE